MQQLHQLLRFPPTFLPPATFRPTLLATYADSLYLHIYLHMIAQRGKKRRRGWFPSASGTIKIFSYL